MYSHCGDLKIIQFRCAGAATHSDVQHTFKKYLIMQDKDSIFKIVFKSC